MNELPEAETPEPETPEPKLTAFVPDVLTPTLESGAPPASVTELSALAKVSPPEALTSAAVAERVLTELSELSARVRVLGEALAAMQMRQTNGEATLEALAKQIGFLPPQLRLLGNKIDGLTTSIAEQRYRGVLLSLLGVYDLVDQLLRTPRAGPTDESAADYRRNCEVLRAQLRQILETNGLAEISAEGAFDPKLHTVLQRVPCADPDRDGYIVDVVRPGFRTEQQVLRYANVIVSQYVPAGSEATAGED